jgi:acyl dehydratase
VAFTDRLRGRVGETFFVSEPFEIVQVDVDVFAAVTRDWDYMHNDPEWARSVGPWPTTIAHGYYLLSLSSYFHGQAGFPIVATEDEHIINYGLNRVRFIDPVRIGDRIRAHFRLLELTDRTSEQALVNSELRYETDRGGPEGPHMIAETLMLCVSGAARPSSS